jgi:tripartite-type tricarboxylate transporter receptor subunit TctC
MLQNVWHHREKTMRPARLSKIPPRDCVASAPFDKEVNDTAAPSRGPAWLAIAALLFSSAALAQKPPATSFPTKPVRVLIGLSPGGGVDVITRALALRLSEKWGMGVVVENRPTAGGVVAMDAVAQAAPDGHTWLASGSQLELTVVFQRVKFDALKAYEPVVQMSSSPYVLVVPVSLPVRSVRELIDLAKAKPGALNYGTAGPGSSGHLGHELFNQRAGISMTHIPYKGSGAVLPDLAAGRVQLGFLSSLATVTLVKNGSVRAIGVTGAQRIEGIPDVPTISESGMPGFEWGNNYGLFVPARTAPVVINAINQDVTQAMALPDMKVRLAADGAEAPGPHTPAQYRAKVEANIARWTQVVKTAGIQPDG